MDDIKNTVVDDDGAEAVIEQDNPFTCCYCGGNGTIGTTDTLRK